jgi:uncharacterized caspase-like protein
MKRFIILAILLTIIASAYADRKALIISNPSFEKYNLPSAVNDANLVEQAFTALDFHITRAHELDYVQMLEAIDKFKTTLRSGDTAVFYYSGFAEQQCGKNYLLPANPGIPDKNTGNQGKISVEVVLEALTRATESFVILETRQTPGSFLSFLSKNRGLAPVSHLAKNQSFVMAQSPNRDFTTRDGEFSIFTYTLLNKLSSEMIDFKELMEWVKTEVRTQTKGAQNPYWTSELVAPFSFYQPIQPYKYQFRLPPFKNLRGGGSYNF